MWTATFINLTRRIAGTECNVGDNIKDKIEDIPLLKNQREIELEDLIFCMRISTNL